MNQTLYILIAIVAGVVSGGAASVIYRFSLKSKWENLKHEAENIIEEAKRNSERIKKDASYEAKGILYQARLEAEKEFKDRRGEHLHMEKRLRNREETLERKLDQIERREHDFTRREKDLAQKEKSVQEKEKGITEIVVQQKALLEKISGISTDEARAELLKKVEEDARFESAKLSKRIEDEARESAEKKSKEIISLAVQRYASDYVADATVSAVSLPSDDMKGRIIGREGRNIRALEAATGVDLIVDDTPELITLSTFNPVRREIARLSLERLIADGRIHPARIEEVVEKTRREVEATIKEEGEKAIFDLGLSGIHPELVKLIGRLKYRTSYGQNVLQHSREVAYFAGMMASEIGADVKLARRAGLLHDIGKAVDHEVEGPHQEIGANLAKKYGESDPVVDAIFSHHDGEVKTAEAALVAAGDAISAARPGVRSESIENYLKRLGKLEELAMSYKGVEKCYAIQAGREVRIIVKPEEVTDEASWILSKDLAKKIEAEMTYPGQIKVTVIRENRFVEYAK
ncbi:MAG: ribonuclease Y [Nitrospiraceae bacterium]|nr:ribonuclease Y [Nitrospiraceae bacterium]